MVTPPRLPSHLGQMVALLAIVNLWLGICAFVTPSHAQSRTIRIITFGDSLTAGYALASAQAFPARMEAKLKARGHDVAVINASVSGDTTAAGLARLDWAVPDDADAVIVELGANDALRGLDPAQARKNLNTILARIDKKGMDVLIAGMLAPRNFGAEYAQAFDRIFPELAAQYDALLYPFILDGIALDAALNLDDGLHPNPRGVDVMVERMLPKVEELIARVKKRHAQTTAK